MPNVDQGLLLQFAVSSAMVVLCVAVGIFLLGWSTAFFFRMIGRIDPH